MNLKIIVFVVIIFTNFKMCQSRRYDGFKLYYIVPTETEHIKFLQNLDAQKYIDVMFWKKPSKMHEDVHLMVNPNDTELFLERAHHFKLEVKMLLPNVQKAFDNQLIKKYMRLRPETYSWNSYHTLKDIYQWLLDISLKFPSFLGLTSIGKSAEGRDIYALKLQKKKAKSCVIVEGGIHGHEWISPQFVLYLANQLIRANRSNEYLRGLSERYIWYFIPLVNPDGFHYSHNEDRLWSKNRRIINGNNVGVDLNRNFPYNFGSHGASYNPNNRNYCGPFALSEPETRALTKFVSSKKNRLRFYFAIHGYGQMIIIPFSDRVKHLGNYKEMENYSKQAIMKIYYRNGIKYRVGTVYDTLGTKISGTSSSWVKKRLKVKYVFTIFLRDNGTFGYALPVEQLEPACEEAVIGVTEMMSAKPRHIVLFSRGYVMYGNYIFVYLSVMVLK